MAEYLIKDATLNAIANAVRSKTGKNETMKVMDIASEIKNITTLPVLSNSGAASDLLSGKELIDMDGNIVIGSMPIINDDHNVNLNIDNNTFNIKKGYHDGTGNVSIETESKTVIPQKVQQNVVPSNGKVLSSVIVEPIPDGYQDTSEITAEAKDVLAGKKIIDTNGNIVEGTILTKKPYDITISGSAIMVPTGYYSSQTYRYMYSTYLNNNITIDNTNGLITAIAQATRSGYISNSATRSSTYQLAFQSAKRITPTIASQVAVPSGYYTGGSIIVNAIPSTYIKPSYKKTSATYIPSTIDQAISAGTYLTGIQTIKGDSNLVPENIKSGVNIFGVNGMLENGGADYLAIRLNGTLQNYSCSGVTKIPNLIFTNCDTLASVNFPDCTFIENGFAYSYSYYTSSYGYRYSYIRYGAFMSCTSLTSISFPACTSIGSYAFYDCTSLTSASFPVCTTIGSSAFYRCSSLTSVNFPVCTSIRNYAFYDCSNLTSISFPTCSHIGGYAFYSCSNLTSVSFPACKSINYSAFAYCESLTSVSFPICSNIGHYAFNYCYNLSNIYLTGNMSVCTLSNSNAFTSTPYAGYSTSFSGTPYIYVPSSLVDAYKTATNWTYFSNYFSAIEEI